MKRKQINSFLESIIPGIKFDYRYGSDFQCWRAPAACDNNCTIWINKDKFFKYSDIEQKGILLHEVGHVLTCNITSEVEAEYSAQMTAIQLAKSHRWMTVYKELDLMISNWATDYKWNYQHGQYRRYILAGRKYNGEKLNAKLTKVRNRSTKVGG